ncbi:prolyl aminopeptidase [bacterium]|jgi:proline iminopeptidase|nr:prolyl aminopeptidase [bacterium]
MTRDPQSWLYPEIEPYRTGMLPVTDGHNLYFEECGSPAGKPAIFIHGGPGGGTQPVDRRYFDPQKYRIILFHQRGAGKSEPAASLHENTTWKLVEDIEALRKHLGVGSWLVFGGSWGSTLALSYAIQHPVRVTELVLRGIFMIRKKEIDWFYQEGANALYPDAWEEYRNHIPEAERSDFLGAYHRRLTDSDPKVQMSAAIPWTRWEMATSRMYTPPELLKSLVTDDFAIRFARIECHYFTNRGFFETEDWILRNVSRIRNIPAVIVQGRYDVVCPMMSAWDLHRAWPEAHFHLIPDGAHTHREPPMARALVAATDRFSTRFA